MEKIPVIVVDKEKKVIDRIINGVRSLQDTGSIKYSDRILDIESLLVKRKNHLVFVGPSYRLSDLEGLLINYSQSLNSIRIILFSEELSAELLKSAIRFNVHDVLEYPANEKDLKNSFSRARLYFGLNGSSGVNDLHDCKKIMFFSTKGGSGNTFLSINFSLAMRKKTNREVILYDLNYQFGDIAMMLNIYPKNTIFDLMDMNKYDEETISVSLTTHSSGVKILSSPVDPSQGEAINADVTTKVFSGLNRICDYLIIDSPFGFTESVLSLIEDIDYMFLVATKDVPSVKNLKICLQLLDRLKFNPENIFVILNRSDSKVDIEIDEIERTIQRKIDVKIPSDRIVPISINKGTPAVTKYPRSNISRGITRMIDIIPAAELIKK